MKHIIVHTLPRRAQDDETTVADGVGFLDILEEFSTFLISALRFKTQETGTPTTGG